jgi:hypothetical protein
LRKSKNERKRIIVGQTIQHVRHKGWEETSRIGETGTHPSELPADFERAEPDLSLINILKLAAARRVPPGKLFVEFRLAKAIATGAWAYNPRMAYLKPILAGLFASAIAYLCFLTWLHMKATSIAEERGTEGLIGVAGSHAYVLHLPAFWAVAIIAFGVGFFLFRDK